MQYDPTHGVTAVQDANTGQVVAVMAEDMDFYRRLAVIMVGRFRAYRAGREPLSELPNPAALGDVASELSDGWKLPEGMGNLGGG